MGFTSVVEDAVARLEDNLHMLDRAEKERPDAAVEARRLHAEGRKIVTALKELLSQPSADVASQVVQLKAELDHERERNASLGKMLNTERGNQRRLEARIQAYEEDLRLHDDLDERREAQQALRRAVAKLREDNEKKDLKIKNQRTQLAAADASIKKLKARIAQVIRPRRTEDG
jgi:hypothetical protein